MIGSKMYDSSKLSWNLTCNSQWRSDAIAIRKKLQENLHAKHYDSFYFIRNHIQRFDPNGVGKLIRRDFERMLGNCGMFLTTQEISTLLRYLGDDSANYAHLPEFIHFLRGELSSDRAFMIEGLWTAYCSNGETSISREQLLDTFNPKNHPLVRSAIKKTDEVLVALCRSLDDICESQLIVSEKEFWGYFQELSACHPFQFSPSFEDIVLDCYCLENATVPVSLERIGRIFLTVYDKLRGKTDVRLPQVITAASKAFNLADKGLKSALDIADFVYFLTSIGIRLIPHETKALFKFIAGPLPNAKIEFATLAHLLEEYSSAPAYPTLVRETKHSKTLNTMLVQHD